MRPFLVLATVTILFGAIVLVILLDSSHLPQDVPPNEFALASQKENKVASVQKPVEPTASEPLEPETNTGPVSHHTNKVMENPPAQSLAPIVTDTTTIASDNFNAQGNLTSNHPLQELIDYLDQKKFLKLIQTFDDRDWGPHTQAALSYRTAAVIQLAEELLEQKKYEESIFMLEHHLSITTEYAGIYSILAETHVLKGNIKKALDLLEEGHALVQDREQAEELKKAQLVIVDQHLDFLKQNEHWSEMIKFIDSDPLPGSDKYYHYKLISAEAYLKLFELEAAEQQLTLAAFDPTLEPEIQKLKQEIEKIRAELLAMRTEEIKNEDDIIVPIQVANGAIFVDVLLNESTKVKLLLDTGASITHLSTDVMNQLGTRGVTSDGKRAFITASGRMEAPVAYLDMAQMETTGVTNLLVAFSDIFSSDSGVDGLLGMNFLRFYNFSFDLDAKELILKHKEK